LVLQAMVRLAAEAIERELRVRIALLERFSQFPSLFYPPRLA
jgi:hypothetical protein